jgi:NADH-quinone oxidoreductase subunit G
MKNESAAMLSLVVPEANSLGLGLKIADETPDLDALTQRADAGEIGTLVILENDLYRRGASADVDRLLDAVDTLVVLDGIETPACSRADLVLPAASTIESEGTFVSMEGRAQRYFSVFPPADQRRPAHQWLLACLKNTAAADFASVNTVDDIIALCAATVPAFAAIRDAAPGAGYLSHGMRIPRQTHRNSGRTAQRANISVHEPKQPQDTESPLVYSMEGLNRDEPGSLLPYVWAPGWNSNQSLHKFQGEVGGAIRGGSAGVRLLDALNNGMQPAAPASTKTAINGDTLELLPRPTIFGSDELSAQSDGIQELVPDPYIELSPEDAKRRDVRPGDGVQVEGVDQPFTVRVDASLTEGFAAFAPGLVGCSDLRPRSRVLIRPAENWTRADAALIASDGPAHD